MNPSVIRDRLTPVLAEMGYPHRRNTDGADVGMCVEPGWQVVYYSADSQECGIGWAVPVALRNEPGIAAERTARLEAIGIVLRANGFECLVQDSPVRIGTGHTDLLVITNFA